MAQDLCRTALAFAQPLSRQLQIATRLDRLATTEQIVNRSSAATLPATVNIRRRSRVARTSAPDSITMMRGSDPSGMNFTWVESRFRATSRAFSASGLSKPAFQAALPTCQTTASGARRNFQPAMRARTLRSTSS